MVELKPCKCGCTDSWVVWKVISQTAVSYYVDCEACGETTEVYRTEQEAIEAWNRKADNDEV